MPVPCHPALGWLQTEGRGGVKRLTPETLVYLEQYNAGGLLKPEVVLR